MRIGWHGKEFRFPDKPRGNMEAALAVLKRAAAAEPSVAATVIAALAPHLVTQNEPAPPEPWRLAAGYILERMASNPDAWPVVDGKWLTEYRGDVALEGFVRSDGETVVIPCRSMHDLMKRASLPLKSVVDGMMREQVIHPVDINGKPRPQQVIHVCGYSSRGFVLHLDRLRQATAQTNDA